MKIGKRTEERIKNSLARFQKVLGIAKARDLNESDTVSIITDILAEVFGYDKYLEVTSELAIRGTYCDLAIKLGDKFQYLIECKAIGTDLKETHLRQAVGYGANKGIQWIILTNGADWQVYRLRFEQPIAWDLVTRFDLETVSAKNERDMEKLAILTKEGVEKGAREELYEKSQCINRFIVGAMLLSEPMVAALKRELRKFGDGISIEDAEVSALLRDSVLRRDLLDGEEADAAKAKISRFLRSLNKKAQAPKKQDEPEPPPEKPMSMSDKILAEAAAAEAKPKA